MNTFKWICVASLWSAQISFGFTNDDLSKLMLKSPITNKPIESIENLVEVLPQELKTNFTFVYDSRSPFKTSISPDFPRVILFSVDAKFILTYTGDPEQPGFNLVETMQFNEEESKFEMAIFDLKEKDKVSRKITTSSCVSCHGADTRPIFDSYPLWPGFYGSVLDSFPKGLKPIFEEQKNYRKFLKTASKKKAYSKLIFKKGSSVSPYLEPKYLVLNENNEAVNPETDFKPNERLGISLTFLNKKRLLRKLQSSLSYKEKRKDILYEFLDCGKSKVKEERLAKITKLLESENKERIDKMKVRGKEKENKLLQMQEVLFARELAQVDWMSEALGVSREDWSMALEPEALSFFDGILSGYHEEKNFYMKEDFIFEILQDLSFEEPEYKNYFATGYTLADYDLPHIDKIDWDKALQACQPLGRDILRAKLENRKKPTKFKLMQRAFQRWVLSFKRLLSLE